MAYRSDVEREIASVLEDRHHLKYEGRTYYYKQKYIPDWVDETNLVMYEIKSYIDSQMKKDLAAVNSSLIEDDWQFVVLMRCSLTDTINWSDWKGLAYVESVTGNKLSGKKACYWLAQHGILYVPWNKGCYDHVLQVLHTHD